MAPLRLTKRTCGSGVEARVGLWGIILFPSKITRTDFYSLMVLVDIHYWLLTHFVERPPEISSFSKSIDGMSVSHFVLFFGILISIRENSSNLFCWKDFTNCMISFRQMSIEQKCDNTVSLSLCFVLIWCKIIYRCCKMACMICIFLDHRLIQIANFFDGEKFRHPLKIFVTFTRHCFHQYKGMLCLEHVVYFEYKSFRP